ncbi:MAG: isoprenylcysteine carboxylmethyltransferase family protein, partial [Betaproteobacteria bacterium]|nr:isoprenylcysteine carboxylmethyltransferase family protein [Betaproteobacteria bacterium]
WRANPHFGPFHVASDLLIIAGFALLAMSWRVLYEAQRAHRVAMTGPYAYLRHPQYAAFMLIMVGFLLQWPTVITAGMFPILVLMYVRLARHEERDAIAEFGEEYIRYAARTPAFLPHPRREEGQAR